MSEEKLTEAQQADAARDYETPEQKAERDSHDPAVIITELSSKLAARSRHVCLLLGAGASVTAGLPGLAGLQRAVLKSLSAEDRKLADPLFKDRNLEDALSRLRRIGSLLGDGGEFEGFDSETAGRLDKAICTAVVNSVAIADADLEPFIKLGSWVAHGDYLVPIELFTINYDLLIETGLEEVGALFFDGFAGELNARFRPDLIEPMRRAESSTLPTCFARLWKLHGSTNWVFREKGDRREVVRLGVEVKDGRVAAIYPSEQKYDDSRRVPFVVLMDRFRRALAEPETLTLVSGYSFGDQHLNEVVFDAALRCPRSETVVLCHSRIPKVVDLQARRTRNILVLSPSEGIVGGQRAPWRDGSTVPGVFEDGRLLLGDFSGLTSFLTGFQERSSEQ